MRVKTSARLWLGPEHTTQNLCTGTEHYVSKTQSEHDKMQHIMSDGLSKMRINRAVHARAVRCYFRLTILFRTCSDGHSTHLNSPGFPTCEYVYHTHAVGFRNTQEHALAGLATSCTTIIQESRNRGHESTPTSSTQACQEWYVLRCLK